jgi:hypothetical protein
VPSLLRTLALATLSFVAALLMSSSAARGGFIFVANQGAGTVSLYTTAGAPVNPTLITGLLTPEAVAVSGNALYVASFGNGVGASGVIGKYTLGGDVINANLITGLTQPVAIAINGSDLFVSNAGTDIVGKYTTSGATIDPTFVSYNQNHGLAVSGSELYVASFLGTVGKFNAATGATISANLLGGPIGSLFGVAASGSDLYAVRASGFAGASSIGKYTTSGATINSTLVSGLSNPFGVAVSGTDLYVSSFYPDSFIGKYTTSGGIVNPMLISSGLNRPYGIAVVDQIPEPVGMAGAVIATLATTTTFASRAGRRRRYC